MSQNNLQQNKLIDTCPRCGNNEFKVPEYICTKCKWQDPTIAPQDTDKGWEERFKEAWITFWDIRPDIHIFPERVEAFLAQEIKRAEDKERERIDEVLEETLLADGFVGFSDEEWSGAKKILNLIRLTKIKP